MPDIAAYSGVAMADIGSINGLTAPSGGGGGYPTSSTGLLLWGYDGLPVRPIHPDLLTGGATVQSFQLQAAFSSAVVKMVQRAGAIMVLLSNGDLYSAGTQATELGRANVNNSTWTVCQTGVTDVTPNNGGFFCIKSGGLYYTGGAPSTIFGSGLSSSYYTWTQYGTDTDYLSIDGYDGYPYRLICRKGSSESTAQLYGAGYNNFGGLGNGLTSGTQTSLTLFKTGASTDFTDYVAQLSSHPYGTGVLTTSGDIYTTGYGNYGHNMNGSSSTISYLTQPSSSTSKTWQSLWMRGIVPFAINTSGELYASPANAIYTELSGGLSGTRQLQKVGTATDWEEIHSHHYNYVYDSDDRPLLWKKGGDWGISANNGSGWNGAKPSSGTDDEGSLWKSATNIEVPVGSSQTIDYGMVVYNQQNGSNDALGILLHVR